MYITLEMHMRRISIIIENGMIAVSVLVSRLMKKAVSVKSLIQ